MTCRLFVISGPSGVGKSTLVAKLLAEFQNLHLAVSATTRSPRPGEVDGHDYYFISEKDFDELLARDAVVEWACVHGNRNATLKSEVETTFADGKSLILDIDTQGAHAVKSLYPEEAYLIFIEPPSIETLAERLEKRGTEDARVQELRLNNSQKELLEKDFYDEVVVNDELDVCFEALKNIIAREMR